MTWNLFEVREIPSRDCCYFCFFLFSIIFIIVKRKNVIPIMIARPYRKHSISNTMSITHSRHSNRISMKKIVVSTFFLSNSNFIFCIFYLILFIIILEIFKCLHYFLSHCISSFCSSAPYIWSLIASSSSYSFPPIILFLIANNIPSTIQLNILS